MSAKISTEQCVPGASLRRNQYTDAIQWEYTEIQAYIGKMNSALRDKKTHSYYRECALLPISIFPANPQQYCGIRAETRDRGCRGRDRRGRDCRFSSSSLKGAGYLPLRSKYKYM
jgi:hypothetical protein